MTMKNIGKEITVIVGIVVTMLFLTWLIMLPNKHDAESRLIHEWKNELTHGKCTAQIENECTITKIKFATSNSIAKVDSIHYCC